MKSQLINSICFIVACLCFLTLAIIYACTNHWLIAVLYMVCVSTDGLNAYFHFRHWYTCRRLMRLAERIEKETK